MTLSFKYVLIYRDRLPPARKVNFFFMGEAIIVGRAAGGSAARRLVTEIYNTNTTWTVPKAIDQVFHIRIFGGGGCGSNELQGNGTYGGIRGGAGGRMNNSTMDLSAGEQIPITIGLGGECSYSTSVHGGTTSFGTYLSALGGEGVSSGGAGASGYSNGGSGGGGGFHINLLTSNQYRRTKTQHGGTGYEFGGGGGYATGGIGGTYGGNGGTVSTTAGPGGKNGINTIGNSSYPDGSGSTFGFDLNLQGAGLCMNPGNVYYGDGGCGGNGGYNAGGGGGGYGGNGGNGATAGNFTVFAGGGGGGYGADGGDAYAIKVNDNIAYGIGGGGGGYGKGGHGGNAAYYSSNANVNGGVAAGGGGVYSGIGGSGGNGICIIQYYI